jgi:site-specific DNA-cytosine methylase
MDLLISGFSCVDYSTLNTNKAKPGEVKAEPSESRDTMNATWAYLKKFKPKMVIIENVRGAPWHVILKDMNDRGYSCHHMSVDSKDYYLPHTRQRGYLFGIRQDAMSTIRAADTAVVTWSAIMSMLKRRASSPAQDFFLADSDMRLILAREEMARAKAANARKAVDWEKCKVRHHLTRKLHNLGVMRPITEWIQKGKCKPADYGWTEWFPTQAERVLDTIDVNHLRSMVSDAYDNTYKS